MADCCPEAQITALAAELRRLDSALLLLGAESPMELERLSRDYYDYSPVLVPLLQGCRGARNRIRMHQPSTGLRYLTTDIHRLGDRHRQPAGQRFCYRNSKILLMRRQVEQLGGMKRTPLEIAVHHPNPMHPIPHTHLLCPALQRRLPAQLIRARQNQLQRGLLTGHRGKGFYQQVHSLLGVDTAQK
jgi:hypothetical protein